MEGLGDHWRVTITEARANERVHQCIFMYSKNVLKTTN